MKHITIFIILTISISFADAQIYFDTMIGQENYYEGPSNVLQNNQNEYIITAGTIKGTETETISYIIKLSEEGNVLQEKITAIEDSSLTCHSVIQLENNNYLFFSTLTPLNNKFENNYIVLTELDEDLNTVSEHKLKFPIDTMWLLPMEVNMKQANENEIVCYGECVVDGGGTFKSFLYKISTTGDSLLYKTLEEHSIGDLEINKSKKIYYTGPQTNDDITVLNYSDFSHDTLVNIFDVLSNHTFLGYASIETLTDSSFVIYGKYWDYINDDHFAIVTLDTNFNILNINTEIYNYGQELQLASMDINPNKEILTTSTGLYSVFFITKTDNELNVIWEYFYDTAPSVVWFITLATNDGGCMMLGTDDATNDIRVVKTDSNGNITHINGEPSEQQAKEVILYPNPATTELTIRKAVQVGSCTVEFFSITGKKVLSQQLTNNTTKIDISNLQKGSYIYKITDNNKVLDSGKWIKQ